MNKKLGLLFFSLLYTGCMPTIVGEWELTEFDEDEMEEELLKSLNANNDGINYSIKSIEMEINMTIDDTLEGEIEIEQKTEVDAEAGGYSATLSSDMEIEGDIEVDDKNPTYEVEGELDGDVTTSDGEGYNDTQEIEESELEMECILEGSTLTCEDEESDLEFIFTKK